MPRGPEAPVDSPTPPHLQALQAALALQRGGHLAEAEALYRQVLTARPREPDALHLLGVCRLQRGDAVAAIELISTAVAVAPANPHAWNNLGAAQRAAGRVEAALASYTRAAALDPGYVDAYVNRGSLLLDQGRLDAARASLDEALRLQPGHVQARYGRALALSRLGCADAALCDFAEVLVLDPGHADAHDNKGVVLQALGRAAEAVACHEEAIRLDPASAVRHVNHAAALLALRRYEAALAASDRALALLPQRAEALVNRGAALAGLHRLTEALLSLDQAIAAQPDLAAAHHQRGGVLRRLGRPAEALAAYQWAATAGAATAELHCDRGQALESLGRVDAALEAYAAALAMDPESPAALARWVHARRCLCLWGGEAEVVERLLAAIEARRPGVNPFFLLPLGTTSGQQRRCAETAAEARFPDFLMRPRAPTKDGGRIRVGYFSSDFRSHPVAHLLAGVIEAHDRKHFEILGFSFGPDTGEPMRRRLQAAFDRFMEVRGQDDAAIAELARAHAIDIAVDLNGWTEGARTGVFARRAAPVQVSYLGYPGTMGTAFIDYLIADRRVVPEERRAGYRERLVELPYSFQANDVGKVIADRSFGRAELGLPEAGMVFCCFNNHYKIGPEVFEVWMHLLRAVPAAVLWLLDGPAGVVANLRREAHARGVDPGRLCFAPRLPLPEYLARYRCADLFLDTFHFNAGTTASDALWAGLPVLTCAGDAFAARMGASLLTAIGLPELIATSASDYLERAIDLARRPERLMALRARLAANRGSAPLFDTGRFTRHLERAYTEMAGRARAGLPPADIVVAADRPEG